MYSIWIKIYFYYFYNQYCIYDDVKVGDTVKDYETLCSGEEVL